MPLSEQQKATIERVAAERGVSVADLTAEAERMLAEQPRTANEKATSGAVAEQPKLFMYLLPFVTVREVRMVWLGLEASFAGDDEVASSWAAKQGGSVSVPTAGEPPPA